MSLSINGTQLSSKIGADFATQYNVPDTGLTGQTTLSNNPLYNALKVLFDGAQTNNNAGITKDGLLVEHPDAANHRLFLDA